MKAGRLTGKSRGEETEGRYCFLKELEIGRRKGTTRWEEIGEIRSLGKMLRLRERRRGENLGKKKRGSEK